MRKLQFLIIGLWVLLSFCSSVMAQQICPLEGMGPKPKGISDLKYFKQFAVLEEGRIKPLETYASNVLLQFSGKRTFNRKSAVDWFARVTFAADSTLDDKIFLINNSEIPTAIGVTAEKKRRYTFKQLDKGYEKLSELAQAASSIEGKERSLVENEILRVFNNMHLYIRLSRTLLFAFPHPDFTIKNNEIIKKLKLPAGRKQFSFLEIALSANELHRMSAGIEKKNPGELSEDEMKLVQLMSNLFNWSLTFQNMPLHIIPISESMRWVSPWDSIHLGLHDSKIREEITYFSNMLESYWTGEQVKFNINANAFHHSSIEKARGTNSKIHSLLKLEMFYNSLNVFFWSKFIYIIVFFLFLLSLLFSRKALYRTAWGAIFLGALLHACGLIMRCLILQRPPVSSLYETFLFVAFICVLAGLILERVHKDWLGLFISAACGMTFLFIADKFSADGDTMKMLVAVLNSNFWLSTHVISITIGYAGSVVACLVAHVYILQSIIKPKNKALLSKTHKKLLGCLGFALMMTFLGTNLGGIWADQSWGRFWGWDPKENGALLIILWIAMIFHAKVSKLFGPVGIAVCSSFIGVIVMWAWFGVNLLSIGLHSYGFMSGVASGLIIYVIAEILFLGITFPLLKKATR